MGRELQPRITEKYLKLSELEDGKFYRCRLSKKEVLLNFLTKDLNENATSYGITYYSETSGYFQTHFPTDYQLSNI